MSTETDAVFLLLCPGPRREGTISVAFVRLYVRLSVCTSVAYVANNLRTESRRRP